MPRSNGRTDPAELNLEVVRAVMREEDRRVPRTNHTVHEIGQRVIGDKPRRRRSLGRTSVEPEFEIEEFPTGGGIDPQTGTVKAA